jgi:hypothetical protein
MNALIRTILFCSLASLTIFTIKAAVPNSDIIEFKRQMSCPVNPVTGFTRIDTNSSCFTDGILGFEMTLRQLALCEKEPVITQLPSSTASDFSSCVFLVDKKIDGSGTGKTINLNSSINELIATEKIPAKDYKYVVTVIDNVMKDKSLIKVEDYSTGNQLTTDIGNAGNFAVTPSATTGHFCYTTGKKYIAFADGSPSTSDIDMPEGLVYACSNSEANALASVASNTSTYYSIGSDPDPTDPQSSLTAYWPDSSNPFISLKLAKYVAGKGLQMPVRGTGHTASDRTQAEFIVVTYKADINLKSEPKKSKIVLKAPTKGIADGGVGGVEINGLNGNGELGLFAGLTFMFGVSTKAP